MLFALSPQAAAATGTASCTGGNLDIQTSPIGMSDGPVNGTVSGTFSGCDLKSVEGTFTGTGNCNDVNATVDADLLWNNGDKTHVSGPFHVPGGTVPPAASNTLPATSGPGAGTNLVVNTGPLDNPAGMVGPCMSDGARSISAPIQSVTLG
ncbi:hypothetical protein GPX89_02070 [Nocardia sp. ET3-3]|uniref:Uncharacterized protein n=1 Tax=Nocardia terrae TaxID=2675851 RepID=A0A7K1UNX9_9NOCA|nr:hypothetical protein [Nocardia terrae]MVU76027.1 hypothetical protein [Nocardia terrae]